MSQAAVAAHNARNACHARGVASLRTAVGVAGARAVVCDTAGAAVAGLSTGAAGVAADLTVRATRSTENAETATRPSRLEAALLQSDRDSRRLAPFPPGTRVSRGVPPAG